MAIDPSIALGFRPPEQPSQMNMLAQAMQLQGLQRQNQLGQMQMEQARAGAERQGQLRNFLSQTDISTPEGQTALQRAYPMEAPKIIGDVLELGDKRQKLSKGAVDTEAAKFKLRQDQITQNLQSLGAITSPEQVPQWLQGGVQSGLITPEQAQAELSAIPRDPQGFAQWKQAQQQAGMTIVQQMDQQWKAKDFGLNVQKFDETKRSNRVTEGISAGNLSVARGNLGLRQKELEQGGGAGKPPAGYRWGAGGALEFIPGGPADPNTKQNTGNITEGERNSGGYATRMTEATKLLDQFESAGRETYTTRVVGALPGVGSAARGETMTPEQQQYRQAAEDWVRAKLRKESGAVIGKDEMEAEIQTYFPMPWDKPEVVAQKRQAREVANGAMRTAAGRGFKPKSGGASGSWEGWSIEPAQ